MKRILAGLLLTLVFVSAGALEQENQVDIKKAGEANAQLALAYIRQGDLATAREKLEKAMDQNPDSVTTQLAAGFLYDRLGDDRKAQSHFEQAVKLSRDDPSVLNSYGVFLCLKVDKKKGEAILLKAAASPMNRNPEFAYANAGRCARADGRPKDAEQYLRKALGYKADQLDALFEMASLEHELGNDLAARAFLERYAAAAPVSAASLWLGYRIERGLGDNAQAALYADRIKRDYPMSAELTALLDAEKAQK
ncbi:MAG: type IV pilus biogenesis/stability protein PilW [Steroidobacteraceae bacterium]